MAGRLNWAKNHTRFKWSNTVFTDECNFDLNECRYGWAPSSQRIPQKSEGYNPKVQGFGAISKKGPIYFTFYEGTLKKEGYVDLLERGFVEKTYEMMGDNWVFQQDVAKPHVAGYTKKFLDENVPSALDWPSKLSDLNSIENLWETLKQRVYSHNPTNIDDLKMYIEEETAKITKKECEGLIGSMNKRVKMVIEAKGNIISY